MLGTGVTMIEVAKELGYYASPLTLSNLCLHNAINKWSAWKPVRDNVRATIDDMSITDITYGFGSDIITLDSGMQCLTSAKANNGDWNYIKPNGTYRLGDFRNYNRDAVAPYSLGLAPTTFYTTLDSEITPITTADIQLGNMEILATASTTWHYGLLYSGTSASTTLVLSDYNLGETNPQGKIDVSLTGLAIGDYDFAWCLTTASSASEVGGKFIYLPGCYWSGTSSIAKTGVIFNPRKNSYYEYPIIVTYNDTEVPTPIINNIKVRWDAQNNESYSISSIKVRIHEYLYNGSTWSPATYHDSGTFTLGAKEIGTGAISFSPGYGSAADDNTGIVLEIVYGVAGHRYYQFDDEWGSGTVVDTEPEPRSIEWLREYGWIDDIS